MRRFPRLPIVNRNRPCDFCVTCGASGFTNCRGLPAGALTKRHYPATFQDRPHK